MVAGGLYKRSSNYDGSGLMPVLQFTESRTAFQSNPTHSILVLAVGLPFAEGDGSDGEEGVEDTDGSSSDSSSDVHAIILVAPYTAVISLDLATMLHHYDEHTLQPEFASLANLETVGCNGDVGEEVGLYAMAHAEDVLGHRPWAPNLQVSAASRLSSQQQQQEVAVGLYMRSSLMLCGAMLVGRATIHGEEVYVLRDEGGRRSLLCGKRLLQHLGQAQQHQQQQQDEDEDDEDDEEVLAESRRR
jgi:hypothetical protein